MKPTLYFLLLFTITFSASAQSIEENPNTLINVNFYSIDKTSPNEPPRKWLSLPDSVKIFANDEPLILYKNYIFRINGMAVEQQFLNANFKFILPKNKTVFNAIAKRSEYIGIEPINNIFEKVKYINSEGKNVEKVTISKPMRLSTDGETFSVHAILAKGEKILYLVDNKAVDESFIAKADDNFMKKVIQMNADNSDLVAKFGERARGFDIVFCIWTSILTNKK